MTPPKCTRVAFMHAEAQINYYEHHIGDYIKATAHLSVQKLARAQSKDERAAVEQWKATK